MEARQLNDADDQEQRWKRQIHQRLLELVDLSLLGTMGRPQAELQIREICQRLLMEFNVPLNLAARQRIMRQIEDELLGLGPLEPLLADPAISDILVNGSGAVYVEKAGKLAPINVRFHNDEHLLSIIDRIVSAVGRRIDESSPMVDARLKDGSRVNAVIPPLAIDGPSLSIRRFAVQRLTADTLITNGSITRPMAAMLAAIVRARLNVLISGGTGSGKTTLLNILSTSIPADERIITIEDSAELQLQQPHVVRLETRPANIEGKGEVTQRDLLRNSLRMRPDRIIVGEVRGAEAIDMLQAMNTGHDGSMTTVHANSARDAVTRIENMLAMAGSNLPLRAMRTQIAAAIDVVIQTERMEDGRRRLVSIQEINGMEGEVVTMSEIFSFVREGVDKSGNVLGRFRPTGIVPRFEERLAKRGLSVGFGIYDPDLRE